MPTRHWPQHRDIDAIAIPFGVVDGYVVLDYRLEPLLEPAASVIAAALRREAAHDEMPIADSPPAQCIDPDHPKRRTQRTALNAGLRNWRMLGGGDLVHESVHLCAFTPSTRALALPERVLQRMIEAARALQHDVDSGRLPADMKPVKIDSALHARFPRLADEIGPVDTTPHLPGWFWPEIARLHCPAPQAALLLARKSRHVLSALYWSHQRLAHALARSPHSMTGLSEDSALNIAAWAILQGESYFADVLARRRLLPSRAPATHLARLIEQAHRARYAAQLPDERDVLAVESEIAFAERCLLDKNGRAGYRVMTIEYLSDAIDAQLNLADERLCRALSLLLDDDTPVVSARLACVAELRWLAARALAAQRRALGDATPVVLCATQPQPLSDIARSAYAADGPPRRGPWSSPSNLTGWYAHERGRGALLSQHYEF